MEQAMMATTQYTVHTLMDGERGTEARTKALLKECIAGVDPAKLRDLRDAEREYRKAQRTLQEATASLASLDDAPPEKAADVATWASKKGQLADLVAGSARY